MKASEWFLITISTLMTIVIIYMGTRIAELQRQAERDYASINICLKILDNK